MLAGISLPSRGGVLTESTLSDAIKHGWMDKVTALCDRGIVYPTREGPHKRTPLYYAAREDNGSLELLLRRCLHVERDVNEVSSRSGSTPLHVAAMYGRWNATCVLLAHKASVTVKNHAGECAEAVARRRGHHAVARIIHVEVSCHWHW